MNDRFFPLFSTCPTSASIVAGSREGVLSDGFLPPVALMRGSQKIDHERVPNSEAAVLFRRAGWRVWVVDGVVLSLLLL